MFIVEHLFRGPTVQNRQRCAMLGDFVEPVGKAAFAAPPLHKRKALPEGLCYGFGLGFAGKGCQIGSQFLSFVISNVQCHVSLQVENFLHRYILAGRKTFLQVL